jgi:hypothetical protein
MRLKEFAITVLAGEIIPESGKPIKYQVKT